MTPEKKRQNKWKVLNNEKNRCMIPSWPFPRPAHWLDSGLPLCQTNQLSFFTYRDPPDGTVFPCIPFLIIPTSLTATALPSLSLRCPSCHVQETCPWPHLPPSQACHMQWTQKTMLSPAAVIPSPFWAFLFVVIVPEKRSQKPKKVSSSMHYLINPFT